MDPEAEPNPETLIVQAAILEAAAEIHHAIVSGQLPSNACGTVRVLDVWGEPGQVAVWAVVTSPN